MCMRRACTETWPIYIPIRSRTSKISMAFTFICRRRWALSHASCQAFRISRPDARCLRFLSFSSISDKSFAVSGRLAEIFFRSWATSNVVNICFPFAVFQNAPIVIIFFQFQSFMCRSSISWRCDVDMVRVLPETRFSEAHIVSKISPSTSPAPAINDGE